MHYTYRNINDAFYGMVKGITEGAIQTKTKSSRNGKVIKVNGPFTLTYTHPKERVLFNLVRDCNPFFHLYESLWMLAGNNDVKSLAYYNSNMKNYSDDGETFNGAYGYRWRHGMGYDQIDWIQNVLQTLPNDRRAVLQMWDGSETGFSDLIEGSRGCKDVPCNLAAVFDIDGQDLNMTVFNRSNDLIWGMLGANVVHFSILQEYLASKLSKSVGQYHQISSNLHIYVDKWKGIEYLNPHEQGIKDIRNYPQSVSLVKNPNKFDEELKVFMEDPEGVFTEPFIKHVAEPMCLAFRHHKERSYHLAMESLERVKSFDWKIAGQNWIRKRCSKHKQKLYGNTTS